MEQREDETRDQYKARVMDHYALATSHCQALVEKLKEMENIIAEIEKEEAEDV
jgi:ribosome-binding protein aMBF1 (putative translation factor)